MDSTVKLSFEKLNWLLGVARLEKNYLTVATANNNFICCHRLNCFDTLRAGIDVERKHFIFYLETKEVAACSSCEQEVLSILAVGQARVLPH